MERYQLEDNDDEDFPYCVCDGQRFDDDGNTIIMAICSDKQDAEMIVRALNGSPT